MSLLFQSKYHKRLNQENNLHSFYFVTYFILFWVIFMKSHFILENCSCYCWLSLVSQSPSPCLLLHEQLSVAIKKQSQKKPCAIRKTFCTFGMPPNYCASTSQCSRAHNIQCYPHLGDGIQLLPRVRSLLLYKGVGSALTHRVEVICIL